MEEEERSCIINIPQVRSYPIKRKALMKICYKRKPLKRHELKEPSEGSVKKYSISDDSQLQADIWKKDELLLTLQRYARECNRIARTKKRGISIYDKYKIASTDLRTRLHVACPPGSVHALTDVDEDFFNNVNGRILEHRGACYKSLTRAFNYKLRKNMEIGYRKDAIANIDLNHRKEQEKYAKSLMECMNQVRYFDQFISEDYLKSMAFLEKCDESKVKVSMKTIELQTLAAEIFTTTSRLVELDYMYSLQQKYGRFLYYLSPPTWRAQNREFAHSVEIEARGFDLGGNSEEDTITMLFYKLQWECAGNLTKPVLYFSHPADLVDVLSSIEMQQQYHFSHTLRMSHLANSLKKGISFLKDSIAQDTGAVTSSISGFKSHIKFYFERSKQLEQKFFQVLNGLFYQSVGTMDVLKFALHLEFCYEKVFKEKPFSTDIVAMAKALEQLFMNYSLRLEALRGESVKKAVQQSIKEEKEKHKKAKEAARELRLFKRLEHELWISCTPQSKKKEKVHVKIASKHQRYHKKIESIRNLSLSESEREYLHVFTDWDETEDAGHYLHIN